jgi:hypothetical protein
MARLKMRNELRGGQYTSWNEIVCFFLTKLPDVALNVKPTGFIKSIN